MSGKIVQADSEDGLRAGEALVEVVENQITAGDPPETKQTLDRLMKMGELSEDAIHYIACALSVKIFGAVKNHEPYNGERYVQNLNALPRQAP